MYSTAQRWNITGEYESALFTLIGQENADRLWGLAGDYTNHPKWNADELQFLGYAIIERARRKSEVEIQVIAANLDEEGEEG